MFLSLLLGKPRYSFLLFPIHKTKRSTFLSTTTTTPTTSNLVSWKDSIATSTKRIPLITNEQHSFSDHVIKSPHFQNNLNKIAIIEGVSGTTRTFKQIESDVVNAGKALQQLGVQKGDVVALFTPNHVDFFTALHAICSIGASVTLINPLYCDRELIYQLTSSSAKIMISASGICLDHAMKALPNAPNIKHLIALDGENNSEDDDKIPSSILKFSSLRQSNTTSNNDKYSQVVPISYSKSISVIPFSSGTTSLPKGVLLTHKNMCVNLDQCYDGESRFFDSKTVVMSPLPLFHIYAFLVSLNLSLMHGKTLITMKRFDLGQFCRLVEQYQCTRAHVVPPIILALAKSPIVDQYNLKSLKVLLSAAAPLGGEIETAVSQRLGCIVKQAWGMSELSPLGTMVPDDAVKSGSVGPPVANTSVKIVDSATHTKILPVGVAGELCIHGPQVMMGYLNDVEKTKQCLTDDGWLLTGDIAELDQDGYVTILDRVKELIKYKGFQVPPAELEALLCTHPAVLDAIVIPRNHEEAGEVPRAYIVQKKDVQVTEKEIIDFVATNTAPHKKLRGGVVFVDTLPKTASGKLLRRQVVEMDRKRKE
jgi:4-coumarate--CoA ligase